MKQTKQLRIRLIPLLLWLMVIWGHSMMPRPMSAEESGGLLRFLIQFLPFLTEHILRKMAHLFEYGVLGMLVLWNQYGRREGEQLKSGSLLEYSELLKHSMIGCWAVAFVDETIQVFSGRGALVTDIWIDLAGAFLGVAAMLILKKKLHKRIH